MSHQDLSVTSDTGDNPSSKGRSIGIVGSVAVVTNPIETENSGSQNSIQNRRSASAALPPTHQSHSDNEVVELDVGGSKFKTCRSTLCRVSGSTLEAMFSGRHANPAHQTDDGSYFIDRDGRHFDHILNFLRHGAVVTLPKNDEEKEALAVEADYYGLDSLVKAIRMPKIDISEYFTEEMLCQREKETDLRKAFCTRSAEGSDPYQELIPIFCPDEGIAPLKYDPDSKTRKEDYLFMSGLHKNRESLGERPPVTVGSLEQFRTNFNREWPNVLHRINQILLEEPVIIAGGSVLRALTASDDVRTGGDWWGTTSDIDMFLYCSDGEDASRIAQRIFYALAADNEKWRVIRSRGVINIHHVDGVQVQVILRLYDSPTEVLIGFDVDCCLCAYDGRNVWLSPRCVSALRSGINVLNPLHSWPNKPSYELRLAKYASRGFAVSVPGIDKCRINHELIRRSNLGDLKGMARFVKVASEMESAIRFRKLTSWDRETEQRTVFERPRTPREVANLRAGVQSTISDDERLIFTELVYVADPFYDVTTVVVPAVYDNRPGWAWNIPNSSESRDLAWQDIVDAGEDCPEDVPRQLVDVWDTGKRSREYLNGNMDKFDLDNLYYSQAYGLDGTNGES